MDESGLSHMVKTRVLHLVWRCLLSKLPHLAFLIFGVAVINFSPYGIFQKLFNESKTGPLSLNKKDKEEWTNFTRKMFGRQYTAMHDKWQLQTAFH